MKPLHEMHASAKGSFDNIYMNGQEVFKFAVRAVPMVSSHSMHLHNVHKKSPGTYTSMSLQVANIAWHCREEKQCIHIFMVRSLGLWHNKFLHVLCDPARHSKEHWPQAIPIPFGNCTHACPSRDEGFAVAHNDQVVEAALEDAQMSKEDVDFLVLHQANQRILDSAATRLGIPSDRVISNLAEYGNTSAASIPLALDEAVRANTISQGHVVSLHSPFWEFVKNVEVLCQRAR
jgi:hypothetical protein